MLHEFVTTYRGAIIERARLKLTARPRPPARVQELDHGVTLFLTQLSDRLRSESAGTGSSSRAIGAGATRHGRDLMALGFTVSQVVHDYGDICQAITELAIEHRTVITTDEFRMLNGCLDTAIAEAVTEHARITAESRSHEEDERSGQLAHETRDLLNTALLAYQALKLGTVAINGSTGAVLGRSLMSLRDLVDSTLSDLRLGATTQRQVRVRVAPFLDNLRVGAQLHAESLGLTLVFEPGDAEWAVNADPQTLASAVTNLLNNAFKFTHPGGRVVLRARTPDDTRVCIEVEDQCGGIPDSVGDPFQACGERRSHDLAGLGLGLAMARRAVTAHGGDIRVRNIPGAGCVFTIDLPLAAPQESAEPVTTSPGPPG